MLTAAWDYTLDIFKKIMGFFPFLYIEGVIYNLFDQAP